MEIAHFFQNLNSSKIQFYTPTRIYYKNMMSQNVTIVEKVDVNVKVLYIGRLCDIKVW